MFFYLEHFSHTMVLARKEHIYFDTYDNFYSLIFLLHVRTTLLCTHPVSNFWRTFDKSQKHFVEPQGLIEPWLKTTALKQKPSCKNLIFFNQFMA